MGAPIFVDDGGSIRIKLVVTPGGGSKGEMDSLFSVASHRSNHPVHSSHGQYDQVFIINPVITVVNNKSILNLNESSYADAQFQKITIHGDLGVDVVFDKDPGRAGGQGATIYLSGNGLDPILESKEHSRNRSYSVLNAGCISGIEIEDTSGVPTAVPLDPDRLYTSIIIT